MKPSEIFSPKEQRTLRAYFGINWLEAGARIVLHKAHDEEELDAIFERRHDEDKHGVTYEEPEREPPKALADRKSPCECLDWMTDKPPLRQRIVVWDKERAVIHFGRFEEPDENGVIIDVPPGFVGHTIYDTYFVADETRSEWDGEVLSDEQEIMDEVGGLPWRPIIALP